MEAEKTSIDTLKEIAKKANWEFNVQEMTINSRYGHHKRSIIIKNNQIPDSYFISSQTTDFDKYRTYSGIFFPIKVNKNYKLLIRKRDLMDRFSFKKDKYRFRIGNSSFDSKIYIETNNEIETHKLLSSSKIQVEILNYITSADLLFIGFNEINPDLNPELEGKQFLSVFMSLGWMLDKKLIDASFKLGELLRSKFN